MESAELDVENPAKSQENENQQEGETQPLKRRCLLLHGRNMNRGLRYRRGELGRRKSSSCHAKGGASEKRAMAYFTIDSGFNTGATVLGASFPKVICSTSSYPLLLAELPDDSYIEAMSRPCA